MPLSIPEPDFDAWLDYVFQRKHARDSYYHLWCDPHADGPRLHPSELGAFFVRLNRSPQVLLDRFDYVRIAAGVHFLFGTESEYFPAIRQRPVSEALQADVLRSLAPLYTELFDPFSLQFERRVENAAEGSSDLAMAIYMLWDMRGWAAPGDGLEGLFPHGNADQVGIVFEVLRVILGSCRSENCRASALHALGHMHAFHPERVAALVDDFLPVKRKTQPRHVLPDSLHELARSARDGQML